MSGTNEILARLSLLLQLQRRARKASYEELIFIIANETRALLPYRQAVFLRYEHGKLRVEALSGLDSTDSASPLVHWLHRLAACKRHMPDVWGAAPLHAADLATRDASLAEDWQTWLPPAAFWLPLPGSQDSPQGVLVLFRDEPWTEPEQHVLSYVADSYGQALSAFNPPSHRAWLAGLSRRWKVLALLAVLALLYPARDSVLIPAEVTAKDPALVRAPLEGVVERLTVAPNQHVRTGQVLARLDDTQLRSRLVVARKVLDMAHAEYRQLQQQALLTPEVKAGLPLLRGKIEQLTAEADYVAALLERTTINSQSDGVAVFDDPDLWTGRPVALGEKMLFVADPSKVELTMHLPMQESMPLQPGSEVLFFPNITPGSPLPAAVTFISYQAAEQSGESLAFVLRADFAAGVPRLGLRGTAKVYGPRLPLALKALRHPLRVARQWLGW